MQSLTVATPTGSIHLLAVDASIEATQPCPLPVVLVHGMACSADVWETQLAYLAETRQAIALDLRGHGSSSAPADSDYSPAACAADLFAVLAARGLEQIVLVGHSYGSCVALAAAAAKPEKIAQLVLIDPPIDCTQLSPEEYEAQIAPIQAALTGEDWRSGLEASFKGALQGSTPETHDAILARLAATPEAALLGTARELFTFRAVEALDAYLAAPDTQACAIVAESNNFPLSLQNLRPALSTTTFPNTGHWLMLDAPEAFAAALRACLIV